MYLNDLEQMASSKQTDKLDREYNTGKDCQQNLKVNNFYNFS